MTLKEQRNTKSIAMAKYELGVMLLDLYREKDGTVCFNKDKCVTTPKDFADFLYVLSSYYLMDWVKYKDVTAYFEIQGDTIIGGCYNVTTGERLGKRVLASTEGQAHAPYTYTHEEMSTLRNLILNVNA